METITAQELQKKDLGPLKPEELYHLAGEIAVHVTQTAEVLSDHIKGGQDDARLQHAELCQAIDRLDQRFAGVWAVCQSIDARLRRLERALRAPARPVRDMPPWSEGDGGPKGQGVPMQ